MKKNINELKDGDGWISCEKAMPEDMLSPKRKRVTVLVTLNGEGKGVKLVSRIKRNEEWGWTSGARTRDVLAWQPLPKKYEGE